MQMAKIHEIVAPDGVRAQPHEHREAADSMHPSAAAPRMILSSLAGYRAGWLRDDVGAGLAIAAVGLPSAIAYPAIAGLPPETGLYASIAPLVGYALFGPSRRLIVGPDAATVTVLAAVLATMPALASADRAAVAALLALMVGGLYLGARLVGLATLATFLSRPILVGFFAGISLSILVGQIGRVTGLRIEADGLIPPLVELAGRLSEIHWPSLLLALAVLAVLEASRALRLAAPGPVVVVVLAVALSALSISAGWGSPWSARCRAACRSSPYPSPAGVPVGELLTGAAAIFVVSFVAGIVTARSFGARGGYPVDAEREMVGFGAANVAAGLFGAFPVTASDSRTAINASVGGRSQLAGVVAALALLLTILYLGPALALLPIPALGAILITAALSLIDLDALRTIWRISRMEFVFALIALWGAVSLGVLNGILIAIGCTFAYLLHKRMHPRDALLGRVPGRDGFYKLHRRPDARPVPGLAIVLVQGDVLFFNADHVQGRLRAVADALEPGTRWLVLDASAITEIDSTAAAMLEAARADLAARGVALGLAELHADVHGLLDRAGLVAAIGADMIFDDLDDALRAFEASACAGRTDHEQETQKNGDAGPATDPATSKKARTKAYEKELARLQAEIAHLQAWVKSSGARIVVIFEGRDAAGKGGMIKRLTERVSPRVFRVVALPAPSDRQKTQIYMQRYIEQLPAAGEVVIFDRSWYNRPGVERVMGYCSEQAAQRFLQEIPHLESLLIESGITLLKYFLTSARRSRSAASASASRTRCASGS
jgi:sulfate permease, SulP family